MKKTLKNHEVIGEVHVHIGNGQYYVKNNVKKEHTLYYDYENRKIFNETKHNGIIHSIEDVTDYYNEDGSEKQ